MRITLPSHQSSFNGAMTSQPWIPGRPSMVLLGSPLLQWSHDLSAMDTMPLRRPEDVATRSFNGAMTSQPWIQYRQSQCPLPSGGFNGAMTSQPWIQASRSPLCRLRHSFNGAMTSQPWIRRAQAASGVRGNYGFNGAMTSQPWIRPPRRDVRSRS